MADKSYTSPVFARIEAKLDAIEQQLKRIADQLEPPPESSRPSWLQRFTGDEAPDSERF